MQDPLSGAFHLGCWPDMYLPSWSQSSSANLSCVGDVCFSRSVVSQATSQTIIFPASFAAGGWPRDQALPTEVSAGDLSSGAWSPRGQ